MTAASHEAIALRIERVIRASRQRVWDAWTRPDELAKWSAPAGLTIPDGAMDLRVGGEWRVVMLEPNGARHVAFGVYREIDPPSRLVYTHQWESGDGSTPETILTLELRAEGERTRLVLTQTGFDSAASRDGHRDGWISAIDNLEKLFA